MAVSVKEVVRVKVLELPATVNSILASFADVSVLIVGTIRVVRLLVPVGEPVAAWLSKP